MPSARGRVFLAALTAFVWGAACVRQVPVERLERPAETGVPARFTFDRPLRWQFSDGTPPQSGAEVAHVFTSPGAFEVKGYDGERLARHLTVLVEPRGVLHVVPPSAQWAVVSRTLDELSATLDVAEALAGPERVQRVLDEVPLLAFALEYGGAPAAALDPLEGAGVALLEGELFLSFVGVKQDAAALETLRGWLVGRGFSATSTASGVEFSNGGEVWLGFTDRGTLFLVRADGQRSVDDAARHVATAADRGLSADGASAALLDALPAGGVVGFARREAVGSTLPWNQLAVALRLERGHATLDGFVTAPAPLWTTPPLPSKRLLTVAPQGPVAVLSASVPARQLAELSFGPRGSRRWKRFDRDVSELGAAADVVLESVGPLAEAALYLDVRRFIRGVVEREGKPDPKGSLVAQLAHSNQAVVEHLVTEALADLRAPVDRAASQGVAVFRTTVEKEPLEIAVAESAAFLKAGSPLARAEVDLTQDPALPDLFGAGHLSLRLDVQQLLFELQTPFTLDGVDPRKLLVAQALAVALVEKLLKFDALVLDAVPDPLGARVRADVTLGSRAKAKDKKQGTDSGGHAHAQ